MPRPSGYDRRRLGIRRRSGILEDTPGRRHQTDPVAAAVGEPDVAVGSRDRARTGVPPGGSGNSLHASRSSRRGGASRRRARRPRGIRNGRARWRPGRCSVSESGTRSPYRPPSSGRRGCLPASVPQSAPSAPRTMPCGWLFRVGSGNSTIVPVAGIEPADLPGGDLREPDPPVRADRDPPRCSRRRPAAKNCCSFPLGSRRPIALPPMLVPGFRDVERPVGPEHDPVRRAPGRAVG